MRADQFSGESVAVSICAGVAQIFSVLADHLARETEDFSGYDGGVVVLYEVLIFFAFIFSLVEMFVGIGFLEEYVAAVEWISKGGKNGSFSPVPAESGGDVFFVQLTCML